MNHRVTRAHEYTHQGAARRPSAQLLTGTSKRKTFLFSFFKKYSLKDGKVFRNIYRKNHTHWPVKLPPVKKRWKMFHFEKKILGAINTDLNCQSRHDLAITLSLFIAHTRDRQKGGCQRDWNWWDGRTWLMRINGQSIIREGPIELNIITKIPIAVFGGHWKVFYPFSTRKEKVREFLGAHRIRTPLARWRMERHLSNCGKSYTAIRRHTKRKTDEWRISSEWDGYIVPTLSSWCVSGTYCPSR